MRTKLNILPPLKNNGQYNHVKAKVDRQQARSALYINKKRGAKPTKIAVGATVRVHKPFHVGEGEMQYSKPLSVQRHTGLSSFILSDRKRWNTACLSLCPEGSTEAPGAETAEESLSPIQTSERSSLQRERQPPQWTKDYAMK